MRSAVGPPAPRRDVARGRRGAPPPGGATGRSRAAPAAATTRFPAAVSCAAELPGIADQDE
ncbi:hypothetical protein, partial [Frankia sp. AgB1.8]|uniref:hypothetical protein n=1 Tax=Frankia sp. AgB1.8 TaxID=2792839 RepID=UPI001EE4E772